MPSIERPYDRGSRRAINALAELGNEFRTARLALGLSQREVAHAARIDRADYSRIEAGKLVRVSLIVTYRIGAVLGLDVAATAFPGGRPIRDAGQAPRMQLLFASVGRPLSCRAEVPLPRRSDRPELRAWDGMLYGLGERTAVEHERRLYDLQAQIRRHRLKLRDDPVDHFLLVVADTKANRRVLSEYADLLADLPLLRTSSVLATLRRGQHPPTGIILLKAPRGREDRRG
jgi:transcriptional regulator with XRE-family HTH domain